MKRLGVFREGGVYVCDGVSCPIPGSWERCMSPGYVVLPDMSDSDGHCGPGIQSFLLFPIPLARALFLLTRAEDVVSAEVRQPSPSSHSPSHSLTLFLSPKPIMLDFYECVCPLNPDYFCLIPSALFPISFCFPVTPLFLLTLFFIFAF